MVSLQLVFFGDAFCKVQLILRCSGCGVGGVAGFAPEL